MVAKLTRLTHKVAIQLHVVAESCTTYSSSSMWSVRKLLDTSSYLSMLRCVPSRNEKSSSLLLVLSVMYLREMKCNYLL
jgi:hypothetical protein